MLILVICVLLGGFLVIHGVTQRFDNLDEAWEAHAKKALPQGREVTRTPEWDRKMHLNAMAFVVAGIVLAGIGMAAGIAESKQPPVMSGIIIDGRPLTLEEWNLCNQDEKKCRAWFGKPTPIPVRPTPLPEWPEKFKR